MLNLEEIFRRLQCCYVELVKEQADNISKLIVDEQLDCKIHRAYGLLKIKMEGFISFDDADNYTKAINEVCGYRLNCCADCNETEWVGIDPICEDDGLTTSTTSSTSTTTQVTSSTSSTSTTTQRSSPVPIPTTTTSTTSTSTTSTSTSSTSSTSTTTDFYTTTSSSTTTSTVKDSTTTTSSTSTTTKVATQGVIEESTYFSIGGEQGQVNDPEITAYLDANQEAWNNPNTGSNDMLFDIDKPTGNIFTYSRGNYDRDDALSVMSLSKGVAAAVILTVIESGQLSLNTTVGSLIPSWASASDNRKAGITLQQIIAHTSGIRDTGDVAGDASLEIAANKMAGTGEHYDLDFAPGSQFRYSTTSYIIAARMAEIATGQSWLNLFNSRIRDKCAMGSAVFNPNQPNQPNPGYELYCTQIAMRNFASMIRDNGVYNGQTVLQPASIEKIKVDMTNGLGDRSFGFVRNAIVGNYATQITLESSSACYFVVDTEDNISYVMFAQGNYGASIGANNGLRSLIRNEIS